MRTGPEALEDETGDVQIIAMTVRPVTGFPCFEYSAKQMVWIIQNTSIPAGGAARRGVSARAKTGHGGARTDGGGDEQPPAADPVAEQPRGDGDEEVPDVEHAVL